MAGDSVGGELVFRSKSAPRKTASYLVTAVICFGAVGIEIAVALWLRVDSVRLRVMTTAPLLLGSFSLLAARQIAQAPLAVRLTQDRFEIRYGKRTEGYPWQDVGWAMTAFGLVRQRYMKIYHVDGRRIATLTDSIERCDELFAQINARVAARTDDASKQSRMAEARRLSVVAFVFGVFMLVGAIALTWEIHEEAHGARLLRTQGLPGQATIVERSLRVTPRLIYRIETRDGRTSTRNAEVTRSVWDDLANAQSVPVVYVPSEPEVSRLVTGEVHDPLHGDFPSRYLVPAVAVALALFLFGLAALDWKGGSIEPDPKTGRFSSKPFGTHR